MKFVAMGLALTSVFCLQPGGAQQGYPGGPAPGQPMPSYPGAPANPQMPAYGGGAPSNPQAPAIQVRCICRQPMTYHHKLLNNCCISSSYVFISYFIERVPGFFERLSGGRSTEGR